MYCLDTSAVIELLYGTQKGQKIKELISTEPITLTSFTIHELLTGLKKEEVTRIKNIFREASVTPFDTNSAFKSALVEREMITLGNRINKIDILIAGICLAHNLNLITCDRDFERVKGLSFTLCN